MRTIAAFIKNFKNFNFVCNRLKKIFSFFYFGAVGRALTAPTHLFTKHHTAIIFGVYNAALSAAIKFYNMYNQYDY